MRSKVSGINSLVLVLVAFSSLVSMFALTRIDNIVHRDLYNYGLTFSYKWAMPYWTMTTIVFAMGWFNIIIACAFQFYVLTYGRKEAEKASQREAVKPEITYQPQAEAPKPQETKPTETARVETKEAVAPPMEVELKTPGEVEEAQKPPEESIEEPITVAEERREEAPEPVEEEAPTESVEAEWEPLERREEEQKPAEEPQAEAIVVEERGEEEMEPRETVETEPQPEERFEEPQEPVDVQFQEETETQEPSTEEQETPSEDIQQQEAELTEPHPA
jgi:hypothetical protein